MNPGLIWSFALSALGIIGILLAGNKNRVGWVVGFFVQPLWIIFALTTGQYGFILNAVIYAVVYARNWWMWRSAPAATPTQRLEVLIDESFGDDDSWEAALDIVLAARRRQIAERDPA
jgi:nicotinamide riboside transporter PnuC